MSVFTPEDRLPHDRAVWRDSKPEVALEGWRQISVDYGDGEIERTVADKASWAQVRRWRYGWPPA